MSDGRGGVQKIQACGAKEPVKGFVSLVCLKQCPYKYQTQVIDEEVEAQTG